MNELLKINSFIEYFKNYEQENKDPIYNVVKLALKFSKEYNKQNTNKFCIFESFSDKYYLENFHSDILKLILSPETKEIGTKKAFELFLAYLGISEDNINDVKVTREKPTGAINNRLGYIDLLICYKAGKNQKAVIIENKINGAKDMPDQLARYMRHVKEKITKDYKVVYLTLDNLHLENKPDLNTYDSKFFDKELQQLRDCNIFFKRAAVSNDDKCLVKGFLKKYVEDFIDEKLNELLKSIKNSNNKDEQHNELLNSGKQNSENIVKNIYVNSEISKYLKLRDFIEHYITLLEHLAGDAFMAEEGNELIKTIYKDLTPEAFEAFKRLVKIWNNKNVVLHQLIDKEVKDLLKIKKLTPKEFNYDDGSKKYEVYIIDTKNNDYSVYFDRREGENNFGIIPKNNSFASKKQTYYKEELEKQQFKSITNDGIIPNEKWVYCNVDVDSKDVIKDTVENIEKLLNINLE